MGSPARSLGANQDRPDRDQAESSPCARCWGVEVWHIRGLASPLSSGLSESNLAYTSQRGFCDRLRWSAVHEHLRCSKHARPGLRQGLRTSAHVCKLLPVSIDTPLYQRAERTEERHIGFIESLAASEFPSPAIDDPADGVRGGDCAGT